MRVDCWVRLAAGLMNVASEVGLCWERCGGELLYVNLEDEACDEITVGSTLESV